RREADAAAGGLPARARERLASPATGALTGFAQLDPAPRRVQLVRHPDSGEVTVTLDHAEPDRASGARLKHRAAAAGETVRALAVLREVEPLDLVLVRHPE